MKNCRNTSESVLFCFFYLGIDLGTELFNSFLVLETKTVALSEAELSIVKMNTTFMKILPLC